MAGIRAASIELCSFGNDDAMIGVSVLSGFPFLFWITGMIRNEATAYQVAN
jgi:hypothetical protein